MLGSQHARQGTTLRISAAAHRCFKTGVHDHPALCCSIVSCRQKQFRQPKSVHTAKLPHTIASCCCRQCCLRRCRMADEQSFIELIIASERVVTWIDAIRAGKRRAVLELRDAVERSPAYAEEACRAGAVAAATRVIATAASSQDEELLDAASAVIAACSGPMSCAGRRHEFTYGDLRVVIQVGYRGRLALVRISNSRQTWWICCGSRSGLHTANAWQPWLLPQLSLPMDRRARWGTV